MLFAWAAPAWSQRVQFTTPAQPVQMTSPYSVPATTPPVASPYAVPPAAPATPYPTTPYTPSPLLTSPPPAAPAYSAPALGPPPAFDPYAVGGTMSPAPPAVQAMPQTFNPPPPASAFPQQPTPIYPNGLPYQYQPPQMNDLTMSGETYWAKTQRLLQELSFEYTYLYGQSGDPFDLEINRAEISSTFAFPMFYNIETPLLVTPGFAFNWLEGPATAPPPPFGPDLPPRLYDAYLDFGWYPRVSQFLSAELGFRTGVWSDFEEFNSHSIRFLGRGLANVSVTPQLDVLFGAVYLDRLDIKLLPAGGVYWRPTPEWDAYIVFPNPKVRKYFSTVGNTKWYWYVAGEYGMGSWTVQRELGGDRIDINDIRVTGGLEWETQTLIRGHVEIGYVWNRELLFNSGQPGVFNLDNTFMVRGGINF